MSRIDKMRPLILDFKWGYLKISYGDKIVEFGKNGERADQILWFNGFENWNWRDPATLCQSHRPGITKQAINYLVDKGCQEVIVTKGHGDPSFTQPGVLETDQSIIDHFTNKLTNKLTIHHLKSELAVPLWNKLVSQDVKVGMLYHATC